MPLQTCDYDISQTITPLAKLIRFFFVFPEFIQSNLERANAMMEEGGDWDRRNRWRKYSILYQILDS